MGQQTSPYQRGGHGILVVAVQVALAIIREHNAGYFAVHPKVGVGITDKHQQTHGVVPPANFILQSKAKSHHAHMSTCHGIVIRYSNIIIASITFIRDIMEFMVV